MNRPAKRQRLESDSRLSASDDADFSEDVDEQLHPEIRDRIAIRNRFKAALEGIFEKYGRDFTSIGDEIDLRTGEVVVDNGHIMRMEDEGDAGGDLTLSEEDLSTEEEIEDSETEVTDIDKPKQPGISTAIHDTNGRQGKGQALESLNLDMIANKLSQYSQSRSSSLAAKAKDPKWQTPELPASAFTGAVESDSDSAYDSEAQELPDLGVQQLKSPKQSLWRDARYTRICKRVPGPTKRRQRRKAPLSIWEDALEGYGQTASVPVGNARGPTSNTGKTSRIQHHDSRERRTQALDSVEHSTKAARDRTAGQTAANFLEAEAEWSVSEEQQLIRYRLNTPLSFAALAPKFPGRSAEMIRNKWQHLKRRIIELSTKPKASIDGSIDNPTANSHNGHQQTSEEQRRDDYDGQDKRHVIYRSKDKHQKVSPSRMHDQINRMLHTDQSNLLENVDFGVGSEDSCNEEVTSRTQQAGNHAQQEEVDDSAVLDFSGIPLEDMWKNFPAIGQLQDASNTVDPRDQHQDDFDIALLQNPIWLNQNPQVTSVPFSVPYGPLEHIDPSLQHQNGSSVLSVTPAAQIDETFIVNGHVQEMDEFQTTYMDILRAGNTGMEFPTMASQADFTTASGTVAQDTSHTPKSLGSFMQDIHDSILPDAEKVNSWITHYDQQQLGAPPYFGSASNAESIRPIQMASIPNTTQEDCSLTFLKSSDGSLGHIEAAHQAPRVSSPIEDRTRGMTAAKAEQTLQIVNDKSQEAPACLLRVSSPLSSTSSSDPRIARPSELLSSIPNSDSRVDKPTKIALGAIDPAILTKTPLVVTQEEEIRSQITSEPVMNDTQSSIRSRTSLENNDPVQQIKPVPAITKRTDRTTQRPGKELNNSKQKLSRTTTDGDRISLDFADDTMSTLDEALEQSCIVSETAVRRYAADKPSVIPATHYPCAPQKSSDIISDNTTLKLYEQARNDPKSILQQMEESAERFLGASDEFDQTTAQITGQHIGLSRNKDMLTNQGSDFESQPYSKAQTPEPTEDEHTLQTHRETTPIDTYRYMLADPWPKDSLPRNKTQKVRNHAKAKKEADTSLKIPGLALHERSQESNSSSLFASPTIQTTASDAGQQPRTRKHQELKSAQSLRHLNQSRLDKLSIVANSRIEEHAARDGSASKSTKPANSYSTKSRAVEHDHQSRRSKSSKRFTIGESTTARRRQSTVPEHDDKASFSLKSPDRLAAVRSIPRKQSPAIRSAEVLLEYGKSRPLTRANLLSQDEIPSTSQDTVLSFLNSQATQLSRPMSTPKSLLLARQAGRSVSPANLCGVDGVQCGRKLCFKCTSRTAEQGGVEF